MKKENVVKAFDAMKTLNIDRDKVKPVLKHLLKVFEGNWEFIEAENYRVLLDAIFDDKEDKEVELKRKKMVEPDVYEHPQKKVHIGPEEDEASSIGDVLPSTLSNGRAEPYRTNLWTKRAEPDSCSAMNKRKEQHSSAILSSSEKLSSARASSSSCSKLPIVESAFVPADSEKVPALDHFRKASRLDAKQLHISSVPFAASTSRIHSGIPDLVEGSSSGNTFRKSSQCVDVDNVNECGSACSLRGNGCRFDIASSPTGDVKLCCVSTLKKEASHAPDIDAILKAVEEKFLRSHNIVGPPFSLKKLLKEICKGFLKTTTDSTGRSLIRIPSSDVTSAESPCCRKKPPTIKNVEVSNQKKSDAETSQILEDGMKRQPHLYVADITKGQENVTISLVDEHGSRNPPKFFYIPKNIIYQKAIVNIALARISDEDCCSSCSGNCLSSPVPCACARTTHGEFAYTQQGILKEEFLSDCISGNRLVYCQDCPIERTKNETKPEKCKGHSLRRFIKECWSKCGCNMQCGNRVVQRGITRQLQVFWTNEGKGWGLRTLEDLPKGIFVCEYVGEVVTNTELDERNKQSRVNQRHTYPVQLDADWGSESILDDDYALCLDATNYGNVARFINHRCCDANLLEIPVEVETVDHHYYHLAFFTTREVKALEELSWDYGLDFDDDSHPIKAFRCRCGSPLCRDKSRKGSRSKARAAPSSR